MKSSLPHLLRNALKSRNPDLASETEAMILNVTPLLWHTLSTFPSGTSHTPQHTTTVEQIAGMLLSPELLRQLSDDEIQLLILACHFHDLGMAGTEFENQNPATQEQARRDHAIRIGDIIVDKWSELGFRNTTLAELLAEVCRGHRPAKSDGHANWNEIRPTGIVAPGRSVRLRLLSALIYAADELHIGSDRAPEREEDWIQLENEESRRHWKRHQRIAGPAVISDIVTFEARPTTIVVEDDLRKHVFRKAFSAVRDANVQLVAARIEGRLPQICVNWLRHGLWQLLLLRVQSDHAGRSEDGLAQCIKQQFIHDTTTSDNLSDLGVEVSTTDEHLTAEIRRVIRDFITRQRLTAPFATREQLLLNTEGRMAQWFFTVARNADNDDVLLAGRYASHHEFDLLSSAYGKAFVQDSLVPIVEGGFGVNLATEQQESPVLKVLQESPTATRLLMEFAPAPSVLVKRHLLRLTVLAGASLDLLRNPELVLKQELRHAVRHLTQEVTDNQPRFLRLIEELALVGGYSYEQIHDAMSHSGSAIKEFETTVPAKQQEPSGSKVTLSITQTIPPHLPATSVSFPYLVLAGTRAGVTVEMLNTEEAPLKINVDAESSQPVPKSPPARIAIGPGQPSLPGRVDMRASFSIDPESAVGELLLYEPGAADRDELPMIIGMPIATMKAGGGTAKTQIGFYWPAVTAQLLDDLERIVELSSEGTVEWSMVSAKDRRMMGTQKFPCEEAERFVPRPFDKEVIKFLCSISPSTLLPWWMPDEELSELARRESDSRMALYEKYGSMAVDEKFHVTSVTLKCTTVDGREIRDEFLGFFPEVVFGPPSITETPDLSQEDLNRRWRNPSERITLGASYTNDYYELATEIREWAEDPKKPFPLNVSSGPPPSPVFKTRFELVNCPHIDRLWYVERPVVLKLRPIQRVEQWEVELGYWESIGEHDRAALLKERIEEDAKRIETTTKP